MARTWDAYESERMSPSTSTKKETSSVFFTEMMMFSLEQNRQAQEICFSLIVGNPLRGSRLKSRRSLYHVAPGWKTANSCRWFELDTDSSFFLCPKWVFFLMLIRLMFFDVFWETWGLNLEVDIDDAYNLSSFVERCVDSWHPGTRGDFEGKLSRARREGWARRHEWLVHPRLLLCIYRCLASCNRQQWFI